MESQLYFSLVDQEGIRPVFHRESVLIVQHILLHILLAIPVWILEMHRIDLRNLILCA